MLTRLFASLVTAALLVTGFSPFAVADPGTPGCTRVDAFRDVIYTCGGPDIDLSLLQKDATRIHVSDGQVLDWTVVHDFPVLQHVLVEGGSNADVAGMPHLPPSVAFVHLAGTSITDLAPLANIDLGCFASTCNNELTLNVPAVTDLSPLATINIGCDASTCVKKFSLYANSATDFSPLGSIGDLTALSVFSEQDNREQHIVNTIFGLPRITGFDGSLVYPTVYGDTPQHTVVDRLTARASVYRAGWWDMFIWDLASTMASTALEASGTAVYGPVSRTYAVIPPGSRGDFNGDGKTDVLSRDSAGVLWLYPGNGKSGFLARVRLGSGWHVMTSIVAPGDVNSDGKPDVLARDSAGVLWFYPGNGKSGFFARVRLGSGWNAMTWLVGPGDFNSDGNPDILARDSAGVLWHYPGNGAGGFNARIKAGSGWNTMTAIVPAMSMNDFNADIFARDASGVLWHYASNGKGGWYPRYRLGSGWNAMTALAGPGDLSGDGKSDVLARDTAGILWLYPGTGGFGLQPRIKVGTGWSGMKAII